MKLIKPIALFTLVLLCSCGIMPHNNEFGASVERTEKSAGGVVTYKPYSILYSEELKKIDAEMLDSAGKVKRLLAIPKGGEIVVRYGSYSIEGAKLDHFTYVVKDSAGTEILRQTGSSSTPYYTISNGVTTWHSLNVIWLHKRPIFPITFYFINTWNSKRSAFKIYEKESDAQSDGS